MQTIGCSLSIIYKTISINWTKSNRTLEFEISEIGYIMFELTNVWQMLTKFLNKTFFPEFPEFGYTILRPL